MAHWLEAETAGNPFFIEAMVSHLVESGAALAERAGASHRRLVDGVSVPDGVRDAVMRRLASLPEAAAEILMTAAVVGSEFDAAVIAQVLAQHLDEVVDALEPVLARRLLVELPGFGHYRFAHALVRQTLEEELSRTRRVRLHHRVALALEEIGASSTELARHFAAGALEGDADKAVDWSRRAATEALDGLAYDEAVASYRTALDALELAGAHNADERADLLMLLAGAANKAGDDDAWRVAALEAADIARRLGDPERLARAAFILLGTLGSAMEVDEEVVAAVRDAADLARVDDRAPAQKALIAELLARLGAYLATDRPEQSAAMLDEALGIARRADNQRVLAIALLNSTLTYTLDQHEGRARLRQAAQLAEAIGDPDVVLAANTGLMIGALLWADRAEFDRSLAEYARVAVEMGAVTPLLLNDINRAGAAALEGRYADAQAAFEDARSRAASLGDPSHVVAITAGMFPVARELGHTRDVRFGATGRFGQAASHLGGVPRLGLVGGGRGRTRGGDRAPPYPPRRARGAPVGIPAPPDTCHPRRSERRPRRYTRRRPALPLVAKRSSPGCVRQRGSTQLPRRRGALPRPDGAHTQPRRRRRAASRARPRCARADAGKGMGGAEPLRPDRAPSWLAAEQATSNVQRV